MSKRSPEDIIEHTNQTVGLLQGNIVVHCTQTITSLELLLFYTLDVRDKPTIQTQIDAVKEILLSYTIKEQ